MALFAGAQAVAAKDVVVTIVSSFGNEYWNNWVEGGQAAADQLGVEFRALSTENDANRHIEIYETQLQSGVKILYGPAQSPGNIPRVAALAKEHGATYLGTWDSLPWFHPIDNGENDYSYVGYVAPDGGDAAYIIGKALFDEMGGKGNVVHIQGFPGSLPEIYRTRGMDRALAEYPDIKLIARQPGEWDQTRGRQIMEDWIVAYDQIDGVFGQNDSLGVGAMLALEEAGITGVPVIGFDGTNEVMELIKEGRFFGTMNYHPAWMGGAMLVRAWDAANGWKPSPCERMMFTGAQLVTQANVDTVIDFLSGDQLPFDYKRMSRVLHPDDWDPQNRLWAADPEYAWGSESKPDGYAGLPAAYTAARDGGECDAVSAMYAAHYKMLLPQ
ncbi:MAG: sugar ABC transporter substrate-binding protein [Gammaproteobacteria bacterium]|nr:sugar ABC transporter substrate-binding protein [Gammaproteobacteria bacterium]